MPGRKPTALKALQGTLRADRQLNEPKPKPIFPFDVPDYFNEDSRLHWNFLKRLLEPMGLLTEADLGQFTALCSAYGRALQADKELKCAPLTVRSNGKEAKNPLLQISRDSWDQYSNLSKRFGLDPLSRGSLDIQQPPEELDPMEILLRKRGGAWK